MPQIWVCSKVCQFLLCKKKKYSNFSSSMYFGQGKQRTVIHGNIQLRSLFLCEGNRENKPWQKTKEYSALSIGLISRNSKSLQNSKLLSKGLIFYLTIFQNSWMNSWTSLCACGQNLHYIKLEKITVNTYFTTMPPAL